MSAPPILFLDLDGTVRHGKDELGHFVNTPDDVVIFPEALPRMRAWRDAGGVIVGVTNQGGVGLGYLTEDAHNAITRATCAGTGRLMDHVKSCTHHPEAGCWCRKPMPGLLYRAAEYVAARWSSRELPDRRQCLMVGDRPEDEEAATAAGVPFQWAVDWRAGA